MENINLDESMTVVIDKQAIMIRKYKMENDILLELFRVVGEVAYFGNFDSKGNSVVSANMVNDIKVFAK